MKERMNMKTDNELRRDVEMELQWDPSVDARDIGVAAKNGVVTLTGQVSNYSEKWRAEGIAKRVAGVVGLANDIEIRLSTERTDTDIAQAAALALKIDTTIPPDQVKVIVEHGWITLEGKVDWHYQKSSAESAVRHLAGVKAVTNAIAITPKVIPAEVRNQIEQAFKRNAQIDARQISIEAHDRKVILRGTVRSWAELHEAETGAWAAPGVSEVDNRLTVRYAED
jgi:VCBS repeat-containing protein